MKKLLCFVFIYSCLFCNAQKQDYSIAYDIATPNDGNFFEREFIEIGRFVDLGILNKIKFLKVKTKNLTSGDSTYYLLIDTKIYKQGSYPVPIYSTINNSEIDDLLESIRVILLNKISKEKLTYCDVYFRSKTGVVIGSYFDLEKGQWVGILSFENITPKHVIYFDSKKLVELYNILKSYKNTNQ